MKSDEVSIAHDSNTTAIVNSITATITTGTMEVMVETTDVSTTRKMVVAVDEAKIHQHNNNHLANSAHVLTNLDVSSALRMNSNAAHVGR